MATLSLLGLYHANNALFSGLVLPEGIDAETMIDNLLLETAELEVLFANPYFMQNAIRAWSRKELPVWDRMWKAMQLEYNPIENYDRIEEWSDERKANRSDTDSTRSASSTEGTSTSTARENGTTAGEKAVTAYNTSTFSPTERDTVDDTRTRTGETEDSTTISGSVNRSGGMSEDETNKRHGRAHGNIGATTTQSMLRQELSVAEFNVIDFIIQSFKRRFCLLVY